MNCAICGSERSLRVAEITDVPVHVGVLWPDPRAAQGAPRGDIELNACPVCGFVHNTRFDPTRVDYTLRYDNALHFSPRFRAYEEELAARLISDHDLRGKHVVEVGCGSGRFLGLLCRLGENRGTGFDPSHDASRADPTLQGRAVVVPESFSPKHASGSGDFLCCRQVLEHIAEPLPFLEMFFRSLRPGAAVYFEVPNSAFIFHEGSVWDVIYEHCNYFFRESLTTLFERAGFEVLTCSEAYGRQFIGIEVRKPVKSRESVLAPTSLPDVILDDLSRFAELFTAKRRVWSARLQDWARDGRLVALWGGGAKAVSFLNVLEVREEVAFVVDLNPAKHGHYVAGSGHPIVRPEQLSKSAPDVVVVMNPIYRREIEDSLRERGLRPQLETL